jgi:predicted lipoprotein with Yx(FWY)xxD motif
MRQCRSTEPGRGPAEPGRRPAMPSRAGLVLTAAAVIAFACGCGSSAAGTAGTGGTPAKNGPTITVKAQSVPGVGKVLVNSQGYALYVFAPDDHRSVTCTGACAGTWPPLMLPSGGRVAAGAGVTQTLLGSDPDPSGGRVITYDGWPLYTYTGDVQPAQATGQNIDLNGGEWYVIRPSGQPLIPAP